MFGWLYQPENAMLPELSPKLGLVVCNPFGFEAICARRSLKTIAEAAAARGIAALYFDYFGCGDSEGDDAGADQMADWIDSIHHAITALKAASGVMRVCLLGLRLGSTLSALAALSREDIAGLIAIAPVVRGRSYLRELRILSATGAVPLTPSTDTAVALESGGFVMTRATCDALDTLDLCELKEMPAPKILVVERDNHPGLDGWPEALQRVGAAVEVQGWPGFSAMTDDPSWAKAPMTMIEGILETLGLWSADSMHSQLSNNSRDDVINTEAIITSSIGDLRVNERVVRIGGSGGMFGVISVPCSPPTLSEKQYPWVLMFNPGAVHHAGPNRLWVRLARRWAAAGFAVLRFDLSGLGDSPPRQGAKENVIYSPHAIQDVTKAIEFLRSDFSAQQLHLVGLCSGGYHVFKAALSGNAVASATMINFFWARGVVRDDVLTDYSRILMVNRYVRGIFSLAPWLRLLRGQLDLRTILLAVVQHLCSLAEHRLREWARATGIPLQEDLATELRRAVDRGTRLHFVFSEFDPAYEMLLRQAGGTVRRLKSQGSLTLAILPNADHTITQYAARERLVAHLDQNILGDNRIVALGC